jgi:hypothetical protein
MTTKQPNLRIIDDPTISETYANKLVSTSFDGHALVVTLGAMRFPIQKTHDAPKEPIVHVSTRVALSPAAAVDLINALSQMLTVLTRHVEAPNATVAPEKVN